MKTIILLSIFSLSTVAFADALENAEKKELLTTDILKVRPRQATAYTPLPVDGFRYDEGFLIDNPSRKFFSSLTVENTKSKVINPKSGTRIYYFSSPYGNQQNTFLKIIDTPFVGPDSAVTMITEIHLFPRVIRPRASFSDKETTITLPTDEPVVFNNSSHEIVDGTIKEKPIDHNKDRFARKNPEVSYMGKGLALTLKRRGNDPRIDIPGKTAVAELTFPSEYKDSCKIPASLLFDQKKITPRDYCGPLLFKFDSNEAFYTFVEKKCNWKLDKIRLMEKEIKENFGQANNPASVCTHCPP